jgi:hypothetical protein
MSPAMEEYVNQKSYHADVEQKKLENLANFFIEKYVLVTKFLSEERFHATKDDDSDLLDGLNTLPLLQNAASIKHRK